MISRKTKKHFLLLEILIALLIVSICLVPLINSPIQSYRAERRLLEEMEGERLADWTFSEIKEKFLKNEIPWGKIPKAGSRAGPFNLPSAEIKIPGSRPRKIERFFYLECGLKGEKETATGEKIRILRIDINFTPRLSQRKNGKSDYSYRMIVKKIPT